jgi:tetratricopeptide (TPR) repeat protein
LQADPKNLTALHLLATIATRLGHHEDAVQLLVDCLDINPSGASIHFDLANALFRSGNFTLALRQCDELLATDAGNVEYSALRAAALVKLGQYDSAILEYEKILEKNPDDLQVLLRYGVALRIVGRAEDAIAAFRAVIERDARNGEAYWNLANLKTFKFSAEEVQAMEQALAADVSANGNRALILFALGKAMDSARQFQQAFEYYAQANKISGNASSYDPNTTTTRVNDCISTFTGAFFSRGLSACSADDPIFIVGLPRSGSTLLEQILASHSQVDATMELSEIPAMVRSLDNPNRTGRSHQFPGVMTELQNDELERLGQEYLKRVAAFRGEKQFFIDKTPHNFLHIGLIKSILPKARIIDARRNPFAAGFSIFTQYFALGSGFAYNLEHIGRYYRDYLRLMDHWHAVLPGQVLTVQYEDVVADMEQQVRRMLDYCGLQFESACLEFYKSKRAVATVSSEQVRQPIYGSALEHWKHYETYLQPIAVGLESKVA